MLENLLRRNLPSELRERRPSFAFTYWGVVDRFMRSRLPRRPAISPLASADLLRFRWSRRIPEVLLALGSRSSRLRPPFQLNQVRPSAIPALNPVFFAPNRSFSDWNLPPKHMRDRRRLASALFGRVRDGQPLPSMHRSRGEAVSREPGGSCLKEVQRDRHQDKSAPHGRGSRGTERRNSLAPEKRWSCEIAFHSYKNP